MSRAEGVERRTIGLELAGAYAGRELEVYTDFPARALEELQSGDLVRVCRALDRYVIVPGSHDLTDLDGEVAPSMLDVYPTDAVSAVIDAYVKATNTLPNP